MMPEAPERHEVAVYITALVPDWAIAEVEGIRYLEGGYGNHNYYFQVQDAAYAIRIPFADQLYVDRDYERTLYEKLPPGLAPDLIAVDVANGILITRWIEGTLLVDQTRPATERLGAFITHLHANTPKAERDYDPHRLARAYLNTMSTPTEIMDVANRRWTPTEGVSCHNDLNPWNVVVAEDRWRVLDWEFAGHNDPLFDVVNLVEGLELPNAVLVEVATDVLGHAPSEAHLLACYEAFWLREYAWAQYQVELGNDRAEIREQVRVAYDKLCHRSI